MPLTNISFGGLHSFRTVKQKRGFKNTAGLLSSPQSKEKRTWVIEEDTVMTGTDPMLGTWTEAQTTKVGITHSVTSATRRQNTVAKFPGRTVFHAMTVHEASSVRSR